MGVPRVVCTSIVVSSSPWNDAAMGENSKNRRIN